MSGIHGLKHVQRLRAAALAHDDPVRTHPQRIDDKIADRDTPLSLHVRRTRLQTAEILMTEFQFRRILHRNDPLLLRDELRKNIQKRRLSGSGSSGHQNVPAGPNRLPEKQRHRTGQTAEPDQILVRQFFRRELPDRDQRTVKRQRRDDRIHPGPVLQSGIHHRRRRVDVPSQRLHNPLNDGLKMDLPVEFCRGPVEQSPAFHKNLFRTVDHDLRNIRVAQQRRERSQTDQIIQQNPPELLRIHLRRNLMTDLPQNLFHRALHLRTHFAAGHLPHRRVADIQKLQHTVLHLPGQTDHGFTVQRHQRTLRGIQRKMPVGPVLPRNGSGPLFLPRRRFGGETPGLRRLLHFLARIGSDPFQHQFRFPELNSVTGKNFGPAGKRNAVHPGSGPAGKILQKAPSVLQGELRMTARNLPVRKTEIL